MNSYRDLFDIPDDVCFLNTAYMGPMPIAAIDAGRAAALAKSQPWTISADDFFGPVEALRASVSKLFGASPQDIAIIPSASYGLATAAQNISLKAGQDVLVLDEQFPSNVYIWRKLAEENGASIKVVKREGQASWTEALLAAIGPQTGLVACPQTHWVDGGFINLPQISDALAPHGGELVLDLSQSLGVQPIDVDRIKPAFAVSVGYKWLMGPYALSYMYVRPDKQKGEPLEQGWINREGAQDFARLVECREQFNPGAERFDMGERSNFQTIPMALPALDLLGEIGPANTADMLSEKAKMIAEMSEPLGVIAEDPSVRSGHYLGMALPETAPSDLLARLRAMNVHVSQRGHRLRVTPHIYTTAADVEHFIEALRKTLS